MLIAVLTHAGNLLPVMIPKVVVKGVSSWPWSHLSRAWRQGIGIRPSSLRSFSLSTTNTFSIIEWIVGPTDRDVCWQMKFWDKEFDLSYSIEQKELVVKCEHSFLQVDGPLTDDVIWDNEMLEQWLLDTVIEKIIHVTIPSNNQLNWIQLRWLETLYRSPFWRSPNEFGRFMSWREQSTVPPPEAAYPRLGLESERFTASWREQVLLCKKFSLSSTGREKLIHTGSTSPLWSSKCALYLVSSTMYAHPLLRPGSASLLETFLRLSRKLASRARKSACKYLLSYLSFCLSNDHLKMLTVDSRAHLPILEACSFLAEDKQGIGPHIHLPLFG